jgi:hypothetical protein
MKWATRKNMKTDRMACAWLIRKYIDPKAEFFFFPAETLLEEARKIGAKTFDAAGADYAHEGMHCSFETMMARHDLWGKDPSLDHMAEIINYSDIRVKLYDFSLMEGFGLWALAQGFANCMPDDVEKLHRALPVYDALFEWCNIKMGKMKLTHYTPPKPPIS